MIPARGQVLRDIDRAPSDAGELAAFFQSLPPTRLAQCWVACVVDAVAQGVALRDLSLALLVVGERLVAGRAPVLCESPPVPPPPPVEVKIRKPARTHAQYVALLEERMAGRDEAVFCELLPDSASYQYVRLYMTRGKFPGYRLERRPAPHKHPARIVRTTEGTPP